MVVDQAKIWESLGEPKLFEEAYEELEPKEDVNNILQELEDFS